ncbi:MAG TPA: YidB family protein [Pseudolabrys sp.]|nr:YidB family protein [Pseudolabrys sp.]
MGLLDSLGGSLRNVAAAAAPALIAEALKQTNLGNLQGVVNQLQQGGLGAQVQSWLGNGANLPVTAEQLRAALGEERVQQLAAKFGVPADQVLKLLADHLPATVDKASPNGKLSA